jgi:hypothetical protein
MKRFKYPLIISVSLAGICLAAWAVAGNYLHRSEPAPMPEEVKPPAPDTRLLKELTAVYDKLSGDAWSVEGSVAITDRENPDNTLAPTSFSYQQNGNRMYYQLGQMEMVNLEDCYIVMQHDAKKILVSSSKQVISAPHLPLETLVKMVEQEEYSVTRKVSEGNATIALGRANHISCKEYAVTYDTATMQLRAIRTRLTNLDAPLDTTQDKIIDVDITRWSPAPQKNRFDKRRYIHDNGRELVPAATYPDYQLIRL